MLFAVLIHSPFTLNICKHPCLQEWQKARREESKQIAKQRQLEAEAEAEKEAEYRKIGHYFKDYPEEMVKEVRKLVARLIKSGEDVEEVSFYWEIELSVANLVSKACYCNFSLLSCGLYPPIFLYS